MEGTWPIVSSCLIFHIYTAFFLKARFTFNQICLGTIFTCSCVSFKLLELLRAATSPSPMLAIKRFLFDAIWDLKNEGQNQQASFLTRMHF